MAFVFADYANEKIDVLKTMKMVLLHDVIEIDAGDTYAYDTEGNKTKRERELKAAERIFGLLPDAQRMEYRGLWDEFEAMETAEAKFANMLDKGTAASSEQCFGRQILGGARRRGVSGACAQQQNT